MSLLQRLTEDRYIDPPKHIDNVCFETITGSQAYGVSADTSDCDVVGFYIPPAKLLFPHLDGHLLGFNKDPSPPKVWQQHHIKTDPDGRHKGKQFDLAMYPITTFFKLAMEGNPNIIDVLYTPRDCILSSTPVGEKLRENRDLFLYRGAWVKYKGYAYGQLHKMDIKQPKEDSDRFESHQDHGYDLKFAYHLVRLLLECEMMLTEHTIDIRRHREHLKGIRRGEHSIEDIKQWFVDKERYLERCYEESTLRDMPARESIKRLLIECLETQYGDLDALKTVRVASNPDRETLLAIQSLCSGALGD